MPPTNLDEQYASDVLRERIRLLFDQLPFALVSNFAISLGLVVMLWRGGQRSGLLAWLTAVAVLGVGRWLLGQRFRSDLETTFDALRWARRYTVAALMSASLLGAAGVLFFREDFLTVSALAIVLVIMSIGSIILHAAHRPAHVAYVLPVLAPFGLHALLSQELVYITVGVAVLLFVPINLYLAKKIRHGVIESILLRFRNQALITELTRQKEIAETAQNEAERATRAKTRFFAAASHDLRQPVQALELFSAALVLELQEHPSRRLAENIRSTGRELSELLDALLDFSKTDISVVKPVMRDFPVADLLNRMADDFALQAAAHGLRCRVVSSSAWVHSDPVLLERIVRNFMGNAIKYTRTGEVLLGCRRVGGALRIEVHDTGIGIPLDQQQNIFNEFIQLENPERDRRKGLGLGLAIVDGLARALAHPLSLRSHLHRGSTFGVTVPLGVPKVAAVSSPSPVHAHAQGSLILLVDDDLKIRESATTLLTTWGYDVVAAETAAEALRLVSVSERKPDVILADSRLREGQTGLDAIRMIHEYCGTAVPTAILTGDTAPERVAEARELGFPLLHKPLSAAKLRTLIVNLLRT